MHTNRTRPAARRGFTMVELLVAITVSSFLIITVFYVMTSSARTFALQSDISQSGDRLNYAMDTIKNDLRRSSFLTVPNAYLGQTQYPWYRQVCAPPTWMQVPDGRGPAAHAIWVREGSGGGAAMEYYEPDERREVMRDTPPDQVILLGAYRADLPFRPTRMQSGASQITVPNGEFTDAEMAYIFDDAWISVSTPAGGLQFLSVTNVTPETGLAQTRLTLGTSLNADPTGTGLEACNFTGFGGGTFEIVPLHFVRYSIVRDPDDRESTVLVREELDARGEPLNNASRYVVARDIVDLQVWFDGVRAGGSQTNVVSDGAEPGSVLTDDDGSLGGDRIDGGALAEPENARFAYIQLTARLDTMVTDAPPQGSGDGLREFLELEDCPNSGPCIGTGEFTRLITMRSEVELQNIDLANTRTLP